MAATFIYIYVNANFTSIFLRLNTRMEQYRTRLNGIDTYLRKNKVLRERRSTREGREEKRRERERERERASERPTE